MSFAHTNLLLKNSFIFFIGTIITGFGGYLYQLAMGRMLSLEDFGTLASLMSFFSFVFLPGGVLATITTQIVASLRARQRYGAIHFLIRRLTRILTWIGFGFFFLFLFMAPFVRQLLQFESYSPYILFSLSTLFIFLLALWRGLFPGLQRFQELSLNTILENFLKLILAVVLVIATFGLSGAVFSIVASSAVAFIFLRWQLRDVWQWPLEPIALKPFFRLAFFIFLWTIALTALSNVDIIFVKRFFSAEETGLYAAMNLLGKIIFFVSVAISGVLFPMSTELFEHGQHKEHRRLMIKALGLTCGVALIGIFFYWFFPTLVVTLLFGQRYLPFVSYLVFFGIVGILLSFTQLLATYFLSIQYRWFLPVLFAAPLIEILLMIFFHARIQDILFILMGVLVGVVFVLLLLFLFFDIHDSKETLPSDHLAL